MYLEPYDSIPLWAVYILTVLIFLAAVEAGFQLSKRFLREKSQVSESGIRSITAATLALLAFILAFLVSYATGIFSERRQLVVKEANAIGTTYLRAGYIDEPYSTESRNFLREYVDQCLAMLDPAKLETALARGEEIQKELWKRAEIIAREKPLPTISLYISSLNDMIDVHTERINVALELRVPSAIFLCVYIVAFLTMSLVGMESSHWGSRNIIAVVLLVLILSVVFLLIVDLDRAQEGFLKIPQQAMLDLQRQLNSMP